MPGISYESFAAWSNYHLTLGEGAGASPFPALTIEDLGRVHAADAGAMAGLERFRASARTLFDHVAHIRKAIADKQAAGLSTAGFTAGFVGRAWSFAPLIGTPDSQLMCDGLAGVSAAADGDIHADRPNPDRIAFALGGTRLREIAAWAAPRGLAPMTSGTHLGPTIAGGAGTASHGSRLGFGGLQNMIVGLHLVTGEDRDVWLERADAPVLSEAGAARLGAAEVIRDDAVFADALVHLGGMGIVNGVALALVPDQRFAVLAANRGIDEEWLERIGAGDFAGLAARLGCDAAPAFYELTLDPHAPLRDGAIHTMYFPAGAEPGETSRFKRLSPADALGAFGKALSEGAFDSLLLSARLTGSHNFVEGGPPDPAARAAIAAVLRGGTSAYAAYLATVQLTRYGGRFDPDEPGVDRSTWRELHPDEITGGIPGALYNASFAVPRAATAAAVAAIRAAVETLPAVFVFTLRFVDEAAGTLAFTRFEHTTVIEIDGISPLICGLTAMLDRVRNSPDRDALTAALRALEPTLSTGAHAVRAALDAAAIDYSMHWAKRGDLDRDKVQRDFGRPGPDGGPSPIARWRATRERLLTPFGRRVFANPALYAYGLLDSPAA
jgi:hypothetical protein